MAEVPIVAPVAEPIIYDEIQVLQGPPDQYLTPLVMIQSCRASLELEKSVSISEGSKVSEDKGLQWLAKLI